MRVSSDILNKVKSFDFLRHIKLEKNGRMRTRLLALQHLKEGKKIAEICSILKIARDRVRFWGKRFLDGGLDGLKEQPGRGRKSSISDEQKIEVEKYLDERAKSNIGGRLFGEDLVRFIYDRFQIKYSLSSTYNLIKELGFGWITSRSIHPKADLPSQEMFKKNLAKCRIGNIKSH